MKTLEDIKREADAKMRHDFCTEDDDTVSVITKNLIEYLEEQGLLMVWRDMDSAPRDGTRIYATRYENNQHAIVIFNGREWEQVDCNGSRLGIGFYPTAWMPLPHVDGGGE